MTSFITSKNRAFLCSLFLVLFSGSSSKIVGDNLSTDSSVSDSLHVPEEDSSYMSAIADTTGIITLDKVVVTANKRQKLLESSQSISIIKPAEWIGTNKTIADVVAEQTGVQTRRFGGTGSFQTLTIRGVQGNEILVLLDGIPLNSAMGGAVDMSAINPDRIGEIEVYKGITPAEFGGNSIGGAINLKSKSSTKVQTLSIQTALGAYGYQKYGLETKHSFSDKTRMFGSLNYIKSDNNWKYLDRNKTPYNTNDDQVRTIKNHHYNFFEARVHPSFDLPGERTLVSGIAYSMSESGIPAFEGSINRTAKHDQNLFMVTSHLYQGKPSEKAKVVITPEVGYVKWSDNTFWTSLDESMGTSHRGITSAPNSYGESNSDLHIAHASCIADMFFTENLGSQFTLQGKHSQIATSSHATGFPHGDWPGNAQELSLAGDFIGSLPISNNKLGVTIGSGVKAVRSATSGGHNDVLEMAVVPSDTIEYPWSVHGGIQYCFEKTVSFFANAARYSNIPGLRDKYGTNGAVIPNPDLKEETGFTIETGLRFLREHLYIEAVFFRTETRNGITMLSDGNMTKPVNLAAGLTYGLEASLWMQPVDLIRFELRTTYQNAENRSKLYNYYSKKLPNEPDLSGIAKLTIVPIKGIEIGYWLDYKSAFFRDYGNTQRVPERKHDAGMLFHNAQLSWKLPQHLDFAFSIRNVNGASLRYEEISRSVESGYSWILYPANEWCFTVGYSF